jgi:hypothetical protein
MLAAELTWADAARVWGVVIGAAGGIGILLHTPGIGPLLRELWRRNVTEPRTERMATVVGEQLGPLVQRLVDVEGHVTEISKAVNNIAPGESTLTARIDLIAKEQKRQGQRIETIGRRQREDRQTLKELLPTSNE